VLGGRSSESLALQMGVTRQYINQTKKAALKKLEIVL
jgi:DNA-binding CsgD family transcriptional regulator